MSEVCAKHEMVEQEIKTVKSEVKDIQIRLNLNERKVDATEIKLDNIIQSINELKAKLDELTKVPAKRWETVIGVGITVIITAMLTYFLKG